MKIRRTIYTVSIAALTLTVVALSQLTHARARHDIAIQLPENKLFHQPGALPRFRNFLHQSQQVYNDSLIRIAVFSTSVLSDSLAHCVVQSLRTLTNDPRADMQASWSRNWQLDAVQRRNGIFTRPVGIYRDTTGNTNMQYREAWVDFTVNTDRPWQLTILQNKNPYPTDFIFSRDTTILKTVHQPPVFAWNELGYNCKRRHCALTVSSEISPGIGAIQPEPVTGYSTWMLHTPDFQSKQYALTSKEQLHELQPQLCIFSIDKKDVSGFVTLQQALRLIDPAIPVLVVTTSDRTMKPGGNHASYLRVNTSVESMKEILKKVLLPW